MENGEQKKMCNCCGKEICMEPMDDREEYLEVTKEWGYFSRKDGEVHHFLLCESCYDRLTERFCLPVEKRLQTELL
ncbi:MAG TPA: hypothetical protein H9880_10485 [Candidatus Anaerobutyricum avicola]|nr:hypothetical protein [Candidatus Anaerobutyricum avicola]